MDEREILKRLETETIVWLLKGDGNAIAVVTFNAVVKGKTAVILCSLSNRVVAYPGPLANQLPAIKTELYSVVFGVS